MSGEAEHRTKVLRVATRCTSLDQFVEAFARYCERRTLFVASMTTRAPGSQSPFVILLADGGQAMRGTCEVVEAWASPVGPFRRPGVRVKFLQLDAASDAVLERLHKFAPPAPVAPKPPVLPPLPPLRSKTPAPVPPPPGPPVATVPPMPPPIPGLTGKPTVRAPATPVPNKTLMGLPPIALAAPAPIPPPRIATIPPLIEDLAPVTPPVPAPEPVPDAEPEPRLMPTFPASVPVEEFTTDVDASPEAIVAIRARADAGRPVRDTAPAEQAPGFEIGGDEELGSIAPPPAGEERTPGSPIILPANPLAAIPDDSLRGFVECTLYEETGTFSFDDLLDRAGSEGDVDDPIAEPPPPPDLRASLPPELKPNPRRDATPVPAPSSFAPAAAAQPFLGAAPAPEAPEAPLPPMFAPEPPPPGPVDVDIADFGKDFDASDFGLTNEVARPFEGAAPLSLPPATLAPPFPPPPAPMYAARTAADDDYAPPRPRRGPIIAGVVAAVLLAAFVIFLLVRNGPSGKPDPAAAATPRKGQADAAEIAPPGASDAGSTIGATVGGTAPPPVTETPPPVTETPPPVTETPPPVTETPPPVTETPPLPGDCIARITTVPDGAIVRADGRVYGETPFDAALPCGRVHLSITRVRYAPVERTVSFTAGERGDLKITLERPEHRIKLQSTPGGATVTIDGAKVGTTPTTVTIPGFSMLTIEMRRAGFKTLRTKHYSKRNGEVVAARLEKGTR